MDPGGVDLEPDPTVKKKPDPDSKKLQPELFSFELNVNIFHMFTLTLVNKYF